MQKAKSLLIISILLMGFSITSCNRSSNEVWEDSKSASRHMSRGLRTMGGKNGSSRAIQSRNDFAGTENDYFMDNSYTPDNNNSTIRDFVPLSDQSSNSQVEMADFVSQQPRNTPGDPGSPIPGISAFQDPSSNRTWSGIFRSILFDYNSNLVKGQDNLATIRSIADYLKQNPNVYIFVEGHTDERGPEAYNLALGSRRSNAVRNLLLQEGVNPDNVFTISYGKERPLFHDNNDDSWAQNRRAEFKIYQR